MLRDDFIQFAESKCGETGTWSWSKCGQRKNTSWSASFVTACAKEFGVDSIVLPDVRNCQDIADKGLDKSRVVHTGKWIDGPLFGNLKSVPEPGDVVLLTCSKDPNSRAEKVAIVEKYDKDNETMSVIEGDLDHPSKSKSVVSMKTYNKNSNCIKGYFRPDWDSVNYNVNYNKNYV